MALTTLAMPRVEIVVPDADQRFGGPPSVLTRVIVNGELWPVESYLISASSAVDQTITLVLHADVTIRHESDPVPASYGRRPDSLWEQALNRAATPWTDR